MKQRWLEAQKVVPGHAGPGALLTLHYILCGTRSLTAMESCAIAGGLIADAIAGPPHGPRGSWTSHEWPGCLDACWAVLGCWQR